MPIELEAAILAPLVAQVLNRADLEVVDWDVAPLKGGVSVVAGRAIGVVS